MLRVSRLSALPADRRGQLRRQCTPAIVIAEPVITAALRSAGGAVTLEVPTTANFNVQHRSVWTLTYADINGALMGVALMM